ncbi:YfbR-like 5'-deoxynucleotidase [Ahrensia sp. R2A130]|uniref:YfbR-like 5'-deoxynucleotidase n=1 Tax=Ahrensia sp. R2A130 TaxID=744979 RepID=UPI0001E0A43D|nr:HD family hydrolase [Ahrensia sp. R2A130]EFL90645.1 metal dependent phosphohydrolase [Ahrensia sp. R2A130]
MTPALPAGRAWQRMLSGRRLDLLDPSPLDVELEDIAHGLARVARWNGQTHGEHAFSVAQHSVLVEQIFAIQQPAATVDDRIAALLHDAPEYVIGDMISPFKQVLGGNYRDVENRLEAAIHQRFGLQSAIPAKLKKAIKLADRAAAWFEATGLAGFTVQEAEKHFNRPNGMSADMLPLEPWSTGEAQAKFAARYKELDSLR